jgi:hypothetical protein
MPLRTRRSRPSEFDTRAQINLCMILVLFAWGVRPEVRAAVPPRQTYWVLRRPELQMQRQTQKPINFYGN